MGSVSPGIFRHCVPVPTLGIAASPPPSRAWTVSAIRHSAESCGARGKDQSGAETRRQNVSDSPYRSPYTSFVLGLQVSAPPVKRARNLLIKSRLTGGFDGGRMSARRGQDITRTHWLAARSRVGTLATMPDSQPQQDGKKQGFHGTRAAHDCAGRPAAQSSAPANEGLTSVGSRPTSH